VSLVRSAAAQPAERHPALVIGNGHYYYGPRFATLMCDARLIAETRKSMGFTLVGEQVQLDLEKKTCDRMVQGFGYIIRLYSDSYILSPLPVALVHTSDMVSLPECLQSLIPNIKESLHNRKTIQRGQEGFMHAAIHWAIKPLVIV
jgi:hypothetical protein